MLTDEKSEHIRSSGSIPRLSLGPAASQPYTTSGRKSVCLAAKLPEAIKRNIEHHETEREDRGSGHNTLLRLSSNKSAAPNAVRKLSATLIFLIRDWSMDNRWWAAIGGEIIKAGAAIKPTIVALPGRGAPPPSWRKGY